MASLTASDRYLRLCLARPLPGAVITALPRYTPVTHAAARGLGQVALPIRYFGRRTSLSRVILGLTDSAPSRRHVSSQPALSPHLSPSATQLRAADGPLALRGRGRGQGGER